jgi:threonylcarbamoyladenosine tRNA methylthiotransferase MtaB
MPETLNHRAALHLVTLGCKVNQYESDVIRGDLMKTGWFKETADGGLADMVIINTCSVTKKAAMQSQQMIRRAIRTHPKAIIIATGCLAQTEPDALAKIQGIDYVIGNAEKTGFQNFFPNGLPIKNAEPAVIRADICTQRIFGDAGFPATGARSRPFIKIQDGCDQFCTYCIVPHARGPSRSRPMQSIVDEIKFFSGKGCHEVVLTGIHIGRWGADFSPPSDLHQLLVHIHQNDLISRVRLSSIEPLEVTDALSSFVADSGRLCPHWHIPLQSGDDGVLKKMNRPYSSEMFFERITRIRHLMPQAAIGTDVMVGFPGETDDAFEQTLALLKSLPVTYFHVFPFSRREPAPAARFPHQVPPEKIKYRAAVLTRLGLEKKAAFYEKMIGKTLNVVIESRRDTATGRLTGVSENYIRVLLDGNNGLKNRLIQCRIVDRISPHAALGELIG